MTVEARMNLQKGVPEDRRFPATDYTSDGSFLDEFLLSQAKARREILDRKNVQQAGEHRRRASIQDKKVLAAEIEREAYRAAENALSDIFKELKI